MLNDLRIKNAFLDVEIYFQSLQNYYEKMSKEKFSEGVSTKELGKIYKILATNKTRLSLSRELKDRKGISKILMKLSESFPDIVGIIKGLISFYEDAIDVGRETTAKQKKDKTYKVQGLVSDLIGEVEKNVSMSMFAIEDRSSYRQIIEKHLQAFACIPNPKEEASKIVDQFFTTIFSDVLKQFHMGVPRMVENILPWEEEVEPTTKSNEKYFALMVMRTFKIYDLKFVASIVDVFFVREDGEGRNGYEVKLNSRDKAYLKNKY